MHTITMIAVEDVRETALWLEDVFGWQGNHGGPYFENLVNGEGDTVLQLHHLEPPEHAHMNEKDAEVRGRGVTIYARVDDVDATWERARKREAELLDGPRENEQSHFYEVTFRTPDGYVFTAFRPLSERS